MVFCKMFSHRASTVPSLLHTETQSRVEEEELALTHTVIQTYLFVQKNKSSDITTRLSFDPAVEVHRAQARTLWAQLAGTSTPGLETFPIGIRCCTCTCVFCCLQDNARDGL
eukprot:scpid110707/ scgid29849/ 